VLVVWQGFPSGAGGCWWCWSYGGPRVALVVGQGCQGVWWYSGTYRVYGYARLARRRGVNAGAGGVVLGVGI
jgi:hypothetical protein